VIPAVKLTCTIVLFAFALLQQGPSPATRTSPSPEKANQEATDKDKKDTNSRGQTSNQSPPATERASSSKAADQNTGPATSKNEEQSVRVVSGPPITVTRSETEFVGLIATVVLALVGIGGIIVAICTLKIVGRQTVAIEKQADAMINSERAWIMVEVEPVPGAGPIWDGETMTREVMDLRAGNTTFTARIICKNDGKAPAWITEKHACLDIVDSLPKTPDWGRIQPIQMEPEPLSVGQIGKPKDEALTCKRPREQGKIVILYGIIKYRDTFRANRTTSFGYKVRDDGALERLPYAKYNENT
jgi:hypothetical protein